MKKYTEPELEIVSFEITDVTNTSDDGFGDNDLDFDTFSASASANTNKAQIEW